MAGRTLLPGLVEGLLDVLLLSILSSSASSMIVSGPWAAANVGKNKARAVAAASAATNYAVLVGAWTISGKLYPRGLATKQREAGAERPCG